MPDPNGQPKPQAITSAKQSALASLERFLAQDRAAWRAWLAANHATRPGVWLVNYKKGSGKPSVTEVEAIDEALCFGWIDSMMHPVDAERYEVLFSPRKPKSTWSQRNKLRIAELTSSGLMADAGLACIAAAKANGSWNALDAVEQLQVPPDLADALAADTAAQRYFDGLSASAKKGIIWWVISAKRPETRSKRIAETVRLAVQGVTAPLQANQRAAKA